MAFKNVYPVPSKNICYWNEEESKIKESRKIQKDPSEIKPHIDPEKNTGSEYEDISIGKRVIFSALSLIFLIFAGYGIYYYLFIILLGFTAKDFLQLST